MDRSGVILAVASPPGRALRGIVRISGEGTFALLGSRLTLQGGDVEAEEAARCWTEGTARRGMHRAVLRFDQGELPCTALLFPGPDSYTGEDSAELQFPGNPGLLERVVAGLLEAAGARGVDARRAEPGEFTARAFLNGKMSLSESEAVAATIGAESDAALRAAQLLSGGKLGGFARELADRLAGALALVEAGIDFTDQEDVVPISPGELYEELRDLREALGSQLAHAVGTEQLEGIPWVVLTGETNAGKSTLFNALLGHDRAVVSPASGTTRDVLVEALRIETGHGPAEVMLVDLAGTDDDESVLNREIQAHARSALERAELVLHCVPTGETAAGGDAGAILVRTKTDLTSDEGEGGLEPDADEVRVSAVTGQGLERLRQRIGSRLAERAVSLSADAVALLPRHEAALRAAAASLDEALALLEPMRMDRALSESELLAASMRTALDALAAVAGEVNADDVLGRIFAHFCIGK